MIAVNVSATCLLSRQKQLEFKWDKETGLSAMIKAPGVNTRLKSAGMHMVRGKHIAGGTDSY